jgi:hypothetical protein
LRQNAIAEQQDQDAGDTEARRHQRKDHPQPAAQVDAAMPAAGAVFEMFAFGCVAEPHGHSPAVAVPMLHHRYGCNR